MNDQWLDESQPDVEGLDETTEIDLGRETYPLDSLMIRTDKRTVHDVCRRIERGVYVLDPDFQRDFIWDEKKQSRLVESCMLRIPLPVFYFAETKEGKIVVVDGLQRLSTFQRFLGNGLRLSGLGYLKEFNGKRFEDLPPKMQNRVEDTNLTLYLIDAQVPDQAKLDIFERVNSGAPLAKQQMRNCLYLGAGTAWLKKMAQSKDFQQATGGGLNPKTMRDRECINRFLAFFTCGDLEDGYVGNMDNFLEDALKRHYRMSEEQERGLTDAFLRSMRVNAKLFGESAFRKVKKGKGRSVINVALFDVFSVLFATFPDAALLAANERIFAGYRKLLSNDTFVDAISLSTNSGRKVATRFEMARSALEEALT